MQCHAMQGTRDMALASGRCRFFDQGLIRVVLTGVAVYVESIHDMNVSDLLAQCGRPE
jgi:hypothetical protein